jgi:peroxiredoxin
VSRSKRRVGATHRAHAGRGGASPTRKTAPNQSAAFRGWGWLLAGAAVLVAGVVVVIIMGSAPASAGSAGSTAYPYVVGSPGPGAEAPPIRLRAGDGTTFDLSTMRGKSVLVFFQEGVGCQPCWEQLKDIESNMSTFKAQGIDQVVTVTGDPADALRQKVALERLRTPVLSDPALAVSVTYQANIFGMMGTSADGHSFVIVGPDGRIRWRADYGGPPKYTMYVPISQLISDMKPVSPGS